MTINFSFRLQAVAAEGSGVSLTSSGAFAVKATLWMEIAEIGVIGMLLLESLSEDCCLLF